MQKWCEIFRTGRHTDSAGNTREWTEDELDTILSNFESKNPDVPICCGHVESNSPAYGWVDELKKEAGKLFASFKQVQPEFAEAVKKGLFKTRSISLTPELVLRHVAFLGAQPPAIKGMEQFCFSENEDLTVIEFEEAGMSSSSRECTGMSLCGTPAEKGVEMPEEDKEKRDAGMSSSAAPAPEGNELKLPLPQGAEFEDLQNAAKEKDAKIAELEKIIAQSKKAAQKKEFEDFCESAVSGGHILPAQKQTVLDILFANAETSINFGDAASKPSNELFMDFIKSLHQIDFSETVSADKVKEAEEIDFSDPEKVKENILAIQKEYENMGIEIDPAQALTKLKGVK